MTTTIQTDQLPDTQPEIDIQPEKPAKCHDRTFYIMQQLDIDFKRAIRAGKREAPKWRQWLKSTTQGFWQRGRCRWQLTAETATFLLPIDIVLAHSSFIKPGLQGGFLMLSCQHRGAEIRALIRHEDWKHLPAMSRWFYSRAVSADNPETQGLLFLAVNPTTGSVMLGDRFDPLAQTKPKE